jgi:peptide deformylase
MIRGIRLYPDPILRGKCRNVKRFNPALGQLVDDLFDTMYRGDGIGLAAPQIGVLQDVFVIDVRKGRIPNKPLVFVNSTVYSKQGVREEDDEEQCLSIPGQSIIVRRPAEITVVAQSETGHEFSCKATGLEARCIQHEFDHLQGKLILDYVTSSTQALVPALR